MVWIGLKQVFTKAGYIVLAAIAALVVFAFATWLPNLALLWQIVTTGSALAIGDKFRILVAFAGSINTNFTGFSALATIMIALLFGANLALTTYLFRRRRQLMRAGGGAASLGGLSIALFGIGCTACGTVVLSPVLSLIGAGALVASLPFAGVEFSLIGIAMLGWSVAWTARKIAQPLACAV